jgi:hypothetical protein
MHLAASLPINDSPLNTAESTPRMGRLDRGIRIAASVTCWIVCGLLIMLWVRSYWWSDTVMGPTKTRLIRFESRRGQVGAVATNRILPAQQWTWISRPTNLALRDVLTVIFPRQRFLGFNSIWNSKVVGLAVPLWFLVLLTGALSAAPWINWSKRFRLRTMLIAVTLIAFVLALIAIASR